MKSIYKGHRFPPEIISHAIWLYHRFTLSFRDVEDLLAERGITVSYEAIRAQRFLSAHGLIQNLFRVGRHHLKAVHYRLLRRRAFSAWQEATCTQ
jgi:hypothetical protein